MFLLEIMDFLPFICLWSLTLILTLFPLVDSHAKYMTTQCSTPLEVGTEIMYGGPAVLSDQIEITISRDGVPLANNSVYFPGEWLSVSLILPSDIGFFEYVFESSSGATFIDVDKVGCDNRRIYNTPIATLQMPILNAFRINSNDDTSVWVGGCLGTFATVEISNKFILKRDSSINIVPTLSPSELSFSTNTTPSSEPTLYQTSIINSSSPINSNITISNSTIPTITSTISPSFVSPTINPTLITTVVPTSTHPSYDPSDSPTIIPSFLPSTLPSFEPSSIPSYSPSNLPSCEPSMIPFYSKTFQPSSSKPTTYIPTSIHPKISSSSSSSNIYKYQFILAVFFSSLTVLVLLTVGLYYWWKYAKARKLATDASKIKNDRYRSYNPTNHSNGHTNGRGSGSNNNNSSGSGITSMFSNMTRRNNRSSSLGSSDDDTTSILMWDRKHSNPVAATASSMMSVTVNDDHESQLNGSHPPDKSNSIPVSSSSSSSSSSSLGFTSNNNSSVHANAYSPQSNMILLGGRFNRSQTLDKSHSSPVQYTTLQSAERDEY